MLAMLAFADRACVLVSLSRTTMGTARYCMKQLVCALACFLEPLDHALALAAFAHHAFLRPAQRRRRSRFHVLATGGPRSHRPHKSTCRAFPAAGDRGSRECNFRRTVRDRSWGSRYPWHHEGHHRAEQNERAQRAGRQTHGWAPRRVRVSERAACLQPQQVSRPPFPFDRRHPAPDRKA